MGTWGPGVFDNDAASDWLGELEEVHSDSIVEYVRETLITAAQPDYRDVDDGQRALVAATFVVAQLPTAASLTMVKIPEDVDYTPFPVDADLRRLALDAVNRIMDRESELPGLWGGDEVFVATVDQLRRALTN
jgi:hypothetical protein